MIGDESFTFRGVDMGSKPVYKIAHYIPMSPELLAQAPGQGWRVPDRNPFPRFDLFPRSTRFVRRYRFMRERIRETIDVARHGLPDYDRDDWD